MRAFPICSRSFDRGPCGADSLLDFLFGRCQWIVRDVQRALLYFGFEYPVQRIDGIRYFLLESGVSKFLDFNSSGHGFAQTRIGCVSFVLHAFKHVRARRDDFVYPLSNCRPQIYLSGKQERRKFDRRSELRLARESGALLFITAS